MFKLKPIESRWPVSAFLLSRNCADYSMVSKGKPWLKSDVYFASFAEATEGEITYFYAPNVSGWEEIQTKLAQSKASLLILNSELSLFIHPQPNQCLLFCAQPKLLFAQLVRHSLETIQPEPFGSYDASCSIAPNSIVEAGARIGRNARIEPNCYIHGNVTIGNDVVIKANTVIGGQGFEFYKDADGSLCHFPHSGGVTIENDVHIGSGVVIDAAVFKQTIIRRGTKIDNLTSIAHNVEIGEDCLVMANCSIAGSVKVGARSRVCLASAIRDGITIGSDAVIGMNACVTLNIPNNVTAYGVPAKVVKKERSTQRKVGLAQERPDPRTLRLITDTIKKLQLNLHGLTIITEAATGHFAVTASIAALAGARVQAISADSPYGSAQEAEQATRRLATELGVETQIELIKQAQVDVEQADIVTNLGFVRPLLPKLIAGLRSGSVIPVMYDARELRPGEIDLDGCRARGIHVVGINEEHPLADILSYCGPLAVKLILEQGIELRGASVAVAGDNFFTRHVVRTLEQNNAGVTVLSDWEQLDSRVLDSLDVLLYLDYWNHLGEITSSPTVHQLTLATGTSLIQFVGGLQTEPFIQSGWKVAPLTSVAPHRMWRTLADLGPRPVIELHAAGLKAAELEFRQVEYQAGTPFDGLRQPIIAFRRAEQLTAH